MKIKDNKTVKVNSHGTRYVVQPEHIRIQAVAELEKGSLSIGHVMEKYGISSKQTIRRWIETYGGNYSPKVRKKVDLVTKKHVVRQLDMGFIKTQKEAARQYGVAESTIRHWLKQYSCGLINENPPQQMSDTSEREKELKKLLEASRLKIMALETMIDIAESSLNIAIRKKSGTKQ